MHDNNILRFGMGIGVCSVAGPLAAVIFVKEAIKQHKRVMEAEQKNMTLDTALDLYEIANKELSRENEELEREKWRIRKEKWRIRKGK